MTQKHFFAIHHLQRITYKIVHSLCSYFIYLYIYIYLVPLNDKMYAKIFQILQTAYIVQGTLQNE